MLSFLDGYTNCRWFSEVPDALEVPSDNPRFDVCSKLIALLTDTCLVFILSGTYFYSIVRRPLFLSGVPVLPIVSYEFCLQSMHFILFQHPFRLLCWFSWIVQTVSMRFFFYFFSLMDN